MRRLERVGDGEHGRLVEGAADQLQRLGQPVGTDAARKRDRGQPETVERTRQALDVFRGNDAADTRKPGRIVRTYGQNPSVCLGTAHEGRVQHARQRQIVDVASVA